MNKTITTVIIIVLLTIGGVLLFGDQGGEQTDDQPTATTTESTTTSEVNADMPSGDEEGDAGATNESTSTDDGDTGMDQDSEETRNQLDASSNQPAATITYENGQFRPQQVTINQGDTVRFMAADETDMWVASDEHPTHTEYDGTSLSEHCNGSTESFDQCEAGQQYSFTFDQTGEFGYHDHIQASAGGTIIVE